jgi:hypothetical protein
MIELTNEQAQALLACPEGPVVNPRTNEVFYLVSREAYEQMKRMIDGPNRRGWDDPELDVYEQYRKRI